MKGRSKKEEEEVFLFTIIRIKTNYRMNKMHFRMAIQDKRESKSKKVEKNGEMKRY